MKREILKRKFFGVAEENAGVAIVRSGRPNENAGIANENFFNFFFRRDCRWKYRNRRGCTPNSVVFEENAGFADRFRTTDDNAGAAEDARLIRIEENENCFDFEAVALFPGTRRDIALMQPTACTDPSGLSRVKVVNSLQAPVHNEESEKRCRRENVECVTSVIFISNEGNKTRPLAI